ncbi:lactoylglutathione lyase [Natronincola peptidivorans]|uniref:Lactoylglutathione lyase n=1 Tax=Natronincola peptidivorans TaxID=426128 RepID=A0A1I0E7K6_9FIRM|nr:VOC family protein [Natronincola peptidivorans]SET40839.1 lactoylglutathione lyase [Natronincola peptidivorans]
MKFCWSTLRVKSMDESLKFYEEIVGLTLDKRFKAGPSMEIAFLGDGDTKIELICDENSNDVNVGTDISWGFEVKSVDEMMNFVKGKGIAVESGPFQPNPHIKFFYIVDPNGLRIQLVENM